MEEVATKIETFDMFVVVVKFNDFEKKIFGIFRSAFDASNWAFSQKWIDDVVWSIDLVNFVKKE